MVVCRAAQEAGVPPVSILTGRKKSQFSHLCSSVIPYPIGTKFAREVLASKGSLHTKYEENRYSHFRDTSKQNFVLISSFFSSSFHTLRKICHKTRMRARIGLKFGTLKGLIKADLCTNLGRNPMKIHGIMTDYLRKIRSKVCHTYRVNSYYYYYQFTKKEGIHKRQSLYKVSAYKKQTCIYIYLQYTTN